jgi:hypothetical protein
MKRKISLLFYLLDRPIRTVVESPERQKIPQNLLPQLLSLPEMCHRSPASVISQSAPPLLLAYRSAHGTSEEKDGSFGTGTGTNSCRHCEFNPVPLSKRGRIHSLNSKQ